MGLLCHRLWDYYAIGSDLQGHHTEEGGSLPDEGVHSYDTLYNILFSFQLLSNGVSILDWACGGSWTHIFIQSCGLCGNCVLYFEPFSQVEN